MHQKYVSLIVLKKKYSPASNDCFIGSSEKLKNELCPKNINVPNYSEQFVNEVT